MLRVMQTRPGTPRGDCRAACYASIFELALDDFPDTRCESAWNIDPLGGVIGVGN